MVKSKQIGITLIELMIVVAIIGIIAAFAYPSYQEHTTKARRSDGQGALLGLAQAMQRHHTTNNSYLGAGQGADTGAPGIYPAEAPAGGTNKYYDLTITFASASAYTLRATPKNAQAGDGIMELTSTGIRRWDENNDGSFGASENKWTK